MTPNPNPGINQITITIKIFISKPLGLDHMNPFSLLSFVKWVIVFFSYASSGHKMDSSNNKLFSFQSRMFEIHKNS